MSRMDTEMAELQEEAQEPFSAADPEEEDISDVDINVGSEPERDEEEEELEQLVFGDSSGFRDHLKNFQQEAVDNAGDDQDITGLEGLDDGDVGQALSTGAAERACG